MMRSKKLGYALLIAMLVIIPIALIAPAVSAPAAGTFSTGEPGIPGLTVPLEIFPDRASHADIYGSLIVYQDQREGDDWEIFLFNITSGKEYQLTNDTVDQIYPAISCDYIIYYENTGGEWDIVLYKIDGDAACAAICPNCTQIYGPPCPPGTVCPPQRNCPSGFVCPPPSDGECDCAANFTWTPDSPMMNESVAFSGTFDLTGKCADTVTVRNWTWDFGDESNATFGQNVTHAFADSGIYNVSLLAALSNGNTCTVMQNVTIGVLPCNCTADFTWDPEVAVVNQSVDFNATVNTTGVCNTTDPVLNWTFGDNSTATGTAVSHTFNATGNYTVTLDVSIGNETTCMATQEIQVFEEAPPVQCDCSANITWIPVAPEANASVEFLGEVDVSEGCNATADAWNWTFGDGNTSTEQNPFYAYNAAGTYPVTLTVTLSDGTTCTAPDLITVVAAANGGAVNETATPTPPVPPVNATETSTPEIPESENATETPGNAT